MLDFQALERQIADQMTTHKIPGLAIGVVVRDEVIYANGFGTTSVEENGVPVTPRTSFRIGSTTKPLVGTVVMRLVEAGKLNLDMPVVQYIPKVRFSRPGAEQVITLRMLLTHTSGLDTQHNPYGSRDPEGGARFVQEILPAVSFVAEPGKLYSYSNPGLALAGQIAAAVCGKPFGILMKEQLFEPLGMKQSTFDPLEALTRPFALSHELRSDGKLEVARPFVENTGQHAAGFAMTTVLDMARFAIMQMGEGRFGTTQLLSAESVREMQAAQASLFTVDGLGYGITFKIGSYRGHKRVGHDGAIHNYNCSFAMLPLDRIAVIVMSSLISPPGVHGGIINSIFDQVLDGPAGVPVMPEPATVDPNPAVWPDLIGSYLSRQWGLITIGVGQDGLTLDMQGKPMALKAHSTDIYYGTWPGGKGIRSVGFLPEKPGERCRYLMVDGTPAVRFDPAPGFSPKRSLLETYAGSYLSPVSGREGICLWIGEDGRLWVKFAWYPGQEFPCVPLNSDTHFASGGGTFTLEDGALLMNGWRLVKAG